MLKLPINEAIEDRIDYEITADACCPEEIATGWYYHVKEKLSFPFQAKCVAQDDASPLQTGEVVQVLKMAQESSCRQALFVNVELAGRQFDVLLSQLEGIGLSKEENEVIQDWHYWVTQGYKFS